MASTPIPPSLGHPFFPPPTLPPWAPAIPQHLPPPCTQPPPPPRKMAPPPPPIPRPNPPPSPFHPQAPPPPHFTPPPPPSPPHHTVIIIAFVSVGGLLFLAFLAAALCGWQKKRKERKAVQKAEAVAVEDHVHVNEVIMPAGPHGQQVVLLSVHEDLKFEEVAKKNQVVETSNAASGLQPARAVN